DGRNEHSWDADVDAELRASVDLAWNVDARHARSDDPKLFRILDGRIRGRRNRRCRNGELGVRCAASRRRVDDEALVGAVACAFYALFLGGRCYQLFAWCNAGGIASLPRTEAYNLSGADERSGINKNAAVDVCGCNRPASMRGAAAAR